MRQMTVAGRATYYYLRILRKMGLQLTNCQRQSWEEKKTNGGERQCCHTGILIVKLQKSGILESDLARENPLGNLR